MDFENMSKKELVAALRQARSHIELLQQEIQIETGYAYEAGRRDMESVPIEIEISPDMALPDGLEALFDRHGVGEINQPFCRAAFYDDPGDPDVGMAGWSAWCLAEDQSGTLLSRIIRAQQHRR